MYLSFEPKKISLLSSADSQSTKYSVSEHMVDPVCCVIFSKIKNNISTFEINILLKFAISFNTLHQVYIYWTDYILMQFWKCQQCEDIEQPVAWLLLIVCLKWLYYLIAYFSTISDIFLLHVNVKWTHLCVMFHVPFL